MRKHKDQQQFFRSITSSKSAAPHNLIVNKSYGLCPSRKQASRLQVKLISTLWGKRRARSREKRSF